MTTSHPPSRCRVISITSARPGAAYPSSSALALIRGKRAINLAELAESIRADRGLSYLVTEAACQELGYSWLSVEQAIVLLGGERVYSLLSAPRRHGRSAAQLRRILHRNRITSEANLSLFETFQEEPI
jgi:hypothetical protein